MSERRIVQYIVYTDGGCSKNNKMLKCTGACAFIITGFDSESNIEVWRECKKYEDTTNNRMELTAAINGLNWIIDKGGSKSHDCLVITDSKYLVDGYHEYLPQWVKNGWRKTDGSQVLNQDLWKMLSGMSPEFNLLRFQWVRGHANNRQNCEVDSMVHEMLYKPVVDMAIIAEKILSNNDPEISDIFA